jgi:hypothetical protein
MTGIIMPTGMEMMLVRLELPGRPERQVDIGTKIRVYPRSFPNARPISD